LFEDVYMILLLKNSIDLASSIYSQHVCVNGKCPWSK
jgi:hypothetical protein